MVKSEIFRRLLRIAKAIVSFFMPAPFSLSAWKNLGSQWADFHEI
jgi:hypothetical protein